MPQPLHLRTAAWRAWLGIIGGTGEAQSITGIAPRTLQRFYSGKELPPPRLLEQLAGVIATSTCHTANQPRVQAVAAQLRAAATPAPEKANA